MTHWVVKYIGRRDIDCWGLLRLIYRDEKGIDLPELPGISSGRPREISREIERESRGNWIAVSVPQDGDAVAMSIREAFHHVGVWIQADGGKVVHCGKNSPVAAETIKMLRLKGIRTIKFFRYGSHS